jgi:hypothetical protein
VDNVPNLADNCLISVDNFPSPVDKSPVPAEILWNDTHISVDNPGKLSISEAVEASCAGRPERFGAEIASFAALARNDLRASCG